MDETDRKLMLSALRATVNSKKGGVALKHLNADYKDLEGDNIPYRQLGFSSLEAFIRSLKDDFAIVFKDGDQTVIAKRCETLAHIQDLVQGQKTTKKRKKPVFKARGSFYNKNHNHYSNTKKPPAYNRSNPRGPSLQSSSRHQRSGRSEYNERDLYRSNNFDSHQPPSRTKAPSPPPQQSQKKNPPRQASPVRRKSPVKDKVKPESNGVSRQPSVSWKPPPPSPVAEPPKATKRSRLKIPDFISKSTDSQEQMNLPHFESLQITVNNEYYNNLPQKHSAPSPLPSLMSLTPMYSNLPNVHPSTMRPPLLPTTDSMTPLYTNLQNIPPTARQTVLPSPISTGGRSSASSSPETYEEPVGLSQEKHLLHLCKYLFNDEPKFNVKEWTDHSKKRYYATVHVSAQPVISTMPDDFPTRDLALASAIDLAITKFNQMKDERLSKSRRKTTEKLNLIIERIYSLVRRNAGHGGLIVSQVENLYQKEHGEILPEGWTYLPEIKNHTRLEFEFTSFNTIVYAKKSTNNFTAMASLPPIVLPDDSEWPVFVTMMESVSKIYFRLVNESDDLYVGMATELNDFMDTEKPDPVDSVSVGGLYCLYDENSWMRVRVEDKKGELYLIKRIDHGEESLNEQKDLYPLYDQFRNVPAQALDAYLPETEMLGELFDYKQLEEDIVGKIFVALVECREPRIVTLYDTEEEPHVNINHFIFEQICKLFYVSALPEGNMFKEKVYVSYISQKESCIFVQIDSLMFQYMTKCIAPMNSEDLSAHSVTSVTETARDHKDEIFLARYNSDGLFYRAKIVSVNPISKLITVLFIDYGNTEIVKGESLIKLFNTSKDHLCLIPPLAIKVKLSALPEFTTDVYKKLATYLTGDEPVILKMAQDGALIHKRNSEGKIVNINALVLAENNVNNSSLQLSTSTRPENIAKLLEHDASPLELPSVPPMGKLIDVLVDTVSNPTNFWIQPTDRFNNLIDLVEEMDDFYSEDSKKSLPPVKSEDIKVGASFAYYHEDKESWTRVTINNKISSEFVAIFLADFGQIMTTDTAVLHYLKSEFRKLPAVAIKCKLHGICPTFGDWTPDDMIRFKELCPESKPFKCEILEFTPDLIGDRECSIRLFDTFDNSRDINIADELVTEGRAKTKE